MFEYLGELSAELGKRYKTLENNLKGSSNSFFDSYREIIQEFIRAVLSSGGEAPKKISISGELNSPELLGRLNTVGTNEAAIEKIRNYVLKTNSHVHKSEKTLTFGMSVDYLNALYNFTAPYASATGLKAKEPSLDEIQALYAEYEKSLHAQRMFSESFEERFEKIERDAEESRAERERAKAERERAEAAERLRRQEEEKKHETELLNTLYRESASDICYLGSNQAFYCFKYTLVALFISFFFFNTVPILFGMFKENAISNTLSYVFVCLFRFLPFLYFFLFIRFLTLRIENPPLADDKTMYEIPYYQPWNMSFKGRYTVGLILTVIFDIGATTGNMIEELSVTGHVIFIIADLFAIAIYILGRIFFTGFGASHIKARDRAGIYRDVYAIAGFFLTKEQFCAMRSDANDKGVKKNEKRQSS